MELKKGQKQGRDERTQEDYGTSAKIYSRCPVVFLRSFISALFLSFFQLHRSLSEIKFYRNFFPLVSVLFRGFSKPPSKYMMNAFTVLQMNTLARGGKMRFAL